MNINVEFFDVPLVADKWGFYFNLVNICLTQQWIQSIIEKWRTIDQELRREIILLFHRSMMDDSSSNGNTKFLFVAHEFFKVDQ